MGGEGGGPFIYVAARYGCKDEARLLAERLRFAGFRIRSAWHDTENPEAVGGKAYWSWADLRDVELSDALVLLNQEGSSASGGGGGCHTEVGYAIGLGKPVVVFGPPSNVFHYGDKVRCRGYFWDVAQTLRELIWSTKKPDGPPVEVIGESP